MLLHAPALVGAAPRAAEAARSPRASRAAPPPPLSQRAAAAAPRATAHRAARRAPLHVVRCARGTSVAPLASPAAACASALIVERK
jgi:hypothetical protein